RLLPHLLTLWVCKLLMLICILTKNVITSCSVTMMLFLHLEVKPLMTLTTVLYLSCALISGHLAMMLMELTKRRQASFLVVFNRPINILCRVSLFLSMALCLLLRLFVFRLLRLKRFSTLTLKVLSYGFRCCHLKNIWTAPLPPETELSRQMTTSTTSIDIMGLQAAYANLHTDQERDYFMQRYHDVISSFGGKTSYDADNRPLLVMRSNLWASGYDVDGTDQTSLGQFS